MENKPWENWWKEYGYYPMWMMFNDDSLRLNWSAIPDSLKSTGGAAVNTESKYPLSVGISGVNTTYGNQYRANINYDLNPQKETDSNGNIVSRVGLNYDLKTKTYTPIFMYGYNNYDKTGGWGADVRIDNRMDPQYSINYQKRF